MMTDKMFGCSETRALFVRAKMQSPIGAVVNLLHCVIDGLKVFEPFRASSQHGTSHVAERGAKSTRRCQGDPEVRRRARRPECIVTALVVKR
jgi:hypothetical protein